MESDTVNLLIELNRQFYQTFGESFSATRQRLQPGVCKIIEQILRDAKVLDLGCGNGELFRTLQYSGWSGEYIGLDFSPELLNQAQIVSSNAFRNSSISDDRYDLNNLDNSIQIAKGTFKWVDLTSQDWEKSYNESTYDFILAFSVLHHIPSHVLRRQILEKVSRLLSPSGLFIHSEWQFLNSERLRTRIQSWSTIGLVESQVESNDFILDWRRDGCGLRYVHHFSRDELEELAHESGFQIIESFYSDGVENNLGLYQVWKLAEV